MLPQDHRAAFGADLTASELRCRKSGCIWVLGALSGIFVAKVVGAHGPVGVTFPVTDEAPALPRCWNVFAIMADLTDEQKWEIVEALACYQDVASIMRAFHKDHGIQLDRKQIGRYDPTRPYYAGGEKWREIFDARRKAYLEDVASVPAANRGYRLQILQEGIDSAKKARNWPLVASLLEQSAKEVGGVLTNERNLKVGDARKLRPEDMTSEERRAAVAELIRQAIESPVPVPAPPLPS